LADADDLFVAYGYVWLPYAIAAVLLAGLAVGYALRRGRGPDTLARALPIRVGALAVLAAVAAGLADAVSEGDGLTVIDQPIWQFAIDHRSPPLTVFFRIVTEVGSTISMTVLAAATIGFLAYRRRAGDAVLVLVVSVGTGLLVLFGKRLVGRERPPQEFWLMHESTQSFPSGHALASMAILGVISLLVGRALGPGTARGWLRVGVAVFILLIGMSRIYLGVHWATDVLGGWTTGAAWLLLCLTIRFVYRADRRSRPVASDAARPAEPPGGPDLQ
jgi:undecaprenyl-diphosphatase